LEVGFALQATVRSVNFLLQIPHRRRRKLIADDRSFWHGGGSEEEN